jgi:2-polyprenyl-3-methyl-5-hydroxy-6-metoxy-1,4-benzoquinol methylase
VNDSVREYFDRVADDFDAIYGGKGPLGRWIDRRFRPDMYGRYRLTFETCGDVGGKTVLDIGCGGGRYSIEFAKRGAAQVVGLDFAPNMVTLAQKYAAEHGVLNRCHFIIGDFMQVDFDQRFDICIAIGVFDYVAQPRLFLEKMRSLANELLVMSFPSKSPIRTPVRKVRYWFKRCPVYFYDLMTIRTLVNGLGQYRIIKIPGQGMDYFVSIQTVDIDRY